MKPLLVAAVLLGATGPAGAQERVPEEEARAIARRLLDAVKDVKLPLSTEVDADKAFAMRREEFGALVLPDRRLEPGLFDKLDKEVVPVGQLWLRNLTPAIDGKALPGDKLQTVKLTVQEKEIEVVVCQLGLRKADGKAELVVLSKGTEPLARLALKPATEKQTLPLEFDPVLEGQERAHLHFGLAGKFQARFTVVPVR